MYLVRQVLKNTVRVLSGLILNKVLLESLEFETLIESGTDLKVFIGVGHLLKYRNIKI